MGRSCLGNSMFVGAATPPPLRSTVLVLFSIVCICFNAGCLRIHQLYPDISTYAFELDVPAHDGQKLCDAIDRFSIDPIFRGKEFVYKYSNGRIEHDYYNQFAVVPEYMIASAVAAWFDVLFLMEQSSVQYDTAPATIISATITELYGDFTSKDHGEAVISILFHVSMEKALKRTIIFTNEYTERIKISSGRPVELIQGWESGLQSILLQLATALREQCA